MCSSELVPILGRRRIVRTGTDLFIFLICTPINTRVQSKECCLAAHSHHCLEVATGHTHDCLTFTLGYMGYKRADLGYRYQLGTELPSSYTEPALHIAQNL